MRRAWLSALLLVVAGCAQVEAPRGGPEEFPPPRLQATRPDSAAIVPGFSGPARFVFQHRLSERGIEDVVRVSPRTSEMRVERHLEELRVRPVRGWEPGLVYQVTVLPGLRDRWEGMLADTLRLVFSTGPEIPETELEGRVLDRITGEPVDAARVELIDLPDSVIYETYSNASGEFTFRHVPPTGFLLRAYEDLDRSKSLRDFEPRDTTTVRVTEGERLSLRLHLLEPDTLPPAVDSVVWRDERAEVHFDRYLDESQDFAVDQAMLRDAAGEEAPVESVVLSTLDEAAAPPEDGPAAPEDPEEDPRPEPAELAEREEPEERVVLPSRVLHVYPLDPLPPGDYTLEVRGVSSVHGLVGGGEGGFEVPEETEEEETAVEEATPAGHAPTQDRSPEP